MSDKSTTEAPPPEKKPEDPKKIRDAKIAAYHQRMAEITDGLQDVGGIAFCTVYLGEAPVNVTQRAKNALDAVVGLVTGLELATMLYGITMERPAPAQPPAVEGSPVDPKEPRYEPIEVAPSGQHTFTVKTLYHDKNQAGDKDILKVKLVEDYEFGGGRWGISCFHPPAQYKAFKTWPLKKEYSPMEGATHVRVQDPIEGGKYPTILDFQP